MGAFDNGFGVWWPCFTTLDSAPASSRWNVYFTMGTLSNEIWNVMDDIAALQQSQDPEYDAGYNGRAPTGRCCSTPGWMRRAAGCLPPFTA